MSKVYLSLIILWSFFSLNGQSISDKQEMTIDANELKEVRIYNLTGRVSVFGTEDNTIELQANRRLTSSSSRRLSDMKEQVEYKSIIKNGIIYLFIQSPDREFRINEEGQGYYRSIQSSNDASRFDINYVFDVRLAVPNGLELHVSNHREDLEINDFKGTLFASNHHDDLIANQIGGNANLYTHHGDIEASLTDNPSQNCEYSSHHGDIRVTYQKQLSADVFLKSRHGEFFTEFDWSSGTARVNVESNGQKTKYVINERTAVTIGTGGPDLTFSSWHGDIYILKQEK